MALRDDCYDKVFPDLPPLSIGTAGVAELGRCAALWDGSALEGHEDESGVDAAWPIFGQFVAHDITADRSPLGAARRSAAITNFRAPRLDLECLYGPGPIGAPYLFDRHDPAKLLLSSSGVDVPRNREGIALIGDARNDSHLLVSQMHVAFATLHNRFVDELRSAGCGEQELFDDARRSTVWHYQHILLREFLPQVVGRSLAAELIEDGPRFFRVSRDEPHVPLEFAAAAYRYGHAQIRELYQVNPHYGPVPLFPDLVGFGPVTQERAVDWSLHIGPGAQKAIRIAARLPGALLHLPPQISGVRSDHDLSSLAARDLARGMKCGLPSGEAVARAMGITPLEPRAIGLARYGWVDETPLWLYVLREAEMLCGGERLGPVGGRIVGDVLVGILDSDPESFRAHAPDWRPWLTGNGSFSLAHVLLARRASALADASQSRSADPES